MRKNVFFRRVSLRRFLQHIFHLPGLSQTIPNDTARDRRMPQERHRHLSRFHHGIGKCVRIRQEFPLHAGDNIIGRASKGTEVDIPIETSDMSMDRRHCIINVKEKGNRPILTVRDNPSLTGTFLRHELLSDRERAVLHDGDVVTIGATTFIVHIPDEEDEEYFE